MRWQGFLPPQDSAQSRDQRSARNSLFKVVLLGMLGWIQWDCSGLRAGSGPKLFALKMSIFDSRSSGPVGITMRPGMYEVMRDQ